MQHRKKRVVLPVVLEAIKAAETTEVVVAVDIIIIKAVVQDMEVANGINPNLTE